MKNDCTCTPVIPAFYLLITATLWFCPAPARGGLSATATVQPNAAGDAWVATISWTDNAALTVFGNGGAALDDPSVFGNNTYLILSGPAAGAKVGYGANPSNWSLDPNSTNMVEWADPLVTTLGVTNPPSISRKWDDVGNYTHQANLTYGSGVAGVTALSGEPAGVYFDDDGFDTDQDDLGFFLPGSSIPTSGCIIVTGPMASGRSFTDTWFPGVYTANEEITLIVTTMPWTGPFCGLPLKLTKSVSEESLNLELGNTNLTYTLEVLNDYTSSFGGLIVTDTLPAEVDFLSSDPDPFQVTGKELVFDLGTLDGGSNALITIMVGITSTVPATITNRATVMTTNTNISVSTAEDTAETLLFRPTDLALSKTADVQGTNLVYTLVVTNRSIAQADDVVLTDVLPPGTFFNDSTPSPDLISGRDYAYNLGSLAPGEASKVSLSLSYRSSLPATVTNTAFVTTKTLEDALGNNTNTAVSVILGEGDLVLTKTVSTNFLSRGTHLTYTLDIVNNSTSTMGGVTVTDSLPAVVTFLSSVPPVLPSGNDVIFNLNALTGGASTSLTIEVSIETLVAGWITNQATVTSTNNDSNPLNNTDIAVTQIPDTDGDGDANPGDPDDDNDGMPDDHEVIAGTLPLNSNSFLWVRIDKTSNDNVRMLTFPGVTGRIYRIQSSTNILADNWMNAQTNIPGPALNNELMNLWRTNSLDRVYYRIGADLP